MPLSWNEIKTRAIAFAKEWEGESSEVGIRGIHQWLAPLVLVAG